MAPTRRPFLTRLPVQLAAMFALALVPIGLLAFLQTSALEKELKAHSETGLMGATLRAAQEEISVINRAQGLVAALAQQVPMVLNDEAACIALMDRVAQTEENASLVAFVPADGQMRCASNGKTFDFSSLGLFARVRDAERPYFVVNRDAPLSGTSVLGVSHPVRDAEGRYLGYATVSLPHSKLRALQADNERIDETASELLTFWTLDGEGNILTSSLDLDLADRDLPADLDLTDLVGPTGYVIKATSVAGVDQTYAVVPIVPGKFYLLSSWQVGSGSLFGTWRIGPYLPTLLMWLGAIVMATVASERLVTRHVRVLNRSIRQFADGDRRLQAIDLPAAPQELRALADAYLGMTESIMHGEARLEDTIHRKRVLLREVHHRVKNNLQLIASIMSIQIRKTTSEEAKSLLKGLQDRVMSLATIHRGLYQTTGMVDVHAAELFPDMVRQIISLSSGGDHPFNVSVDVDDIHLVPDQAVPLSLLLTEALTNAIKHSGGTRANPGQIAVSLKRSGGSGAVLQVQNSTPAAGAAPHDPAIAAMNTGLGSQLIKAFAQQLGGRLDISEADGFCLTVSFQLTPLADAETDDDDAAFPPAPSVTAPSATTPTRDGPQRNP